MVQTLDANWVLMKENEIQPRTFYYVYRWLSWDSWGDPDYCDTVFIIHGNDQINAHLEIMHTMIPNK